MFNLLVAHNEENKRESANPKTVLLFREGKNVLLRSAIFAIVELNSNRERAVIL